MLSSTPREVSVVRRDPTPSLSVRLMLAAIGAIPVSLIGGSTFGMFTLRELTIAVLVPALIILTAVLITDGAATRRLVRNAIVAGMLATFLYDVVRWSSLGLGWMNRDPIPHIGTSLGFEPGWVLGYLWRFVGNGGGIALAFYAFGQRGVVAGAIHGLLVCGGLIGVLAFAPHGEEMLFPLVPSTLFVAVTGHLVYGVSLGLLTKWLTSPLPPIVGSSAIGTVESDV